MSEEKIRWVIGAGETQKFVADVMAFSIRVNCSDPSRLEIIHTYDKPRPTFKGFPDPPNYPKDRDSTPFTYVRLWTPKLLGYQGKAIVTDSDMIVLGDACELFDTDLGDKWVAKCRDTAVLVLDCEKCKWWCCDTAFEKMRTKEWDYKEVLQHLCKTPKDKVLEIDGNWNAFERLDPKTKILHYTIREKQPWDFPGTNRNEDYWIDWAVRATIEGEASSWDARELPIWPKLKAKLEAKGFEVPT